MLKEKDFIELEYVGRTREGRIFDTNIKEEAKKIELDIATRPLIICLGQNMILPAIDKFLIDKEIDKDYTLELKPEEAFGKRDSKLLKTMPMSVFKKQEVFPQAGMLFEFDGMIARISAVSGGRVIVDFNNPLAGKEVSYNLKVKRKIESLEEKTSSIIQFLFRKEFPFKIEQNRLVLEVEKGMSEYVSLFKEKFKEILDLDLEVKEAEKKSSKKQEAENTEENEDSSKSQ